MADTKYYAWSNLTTLDGKKVKPGEQVTQADLVEDEEEFKASYLNPGAVRTMPYPEDIALDESPTDYYRRKALELSESNMVIPSEVQRLAAGGEETEGERALREQSEAGGMKTETPTKVEEVKRS